MKLSNRVSPRNSDSNKGLRIELIVCYTEIKLKPFYKHIYITGGHIHLHGAGHLSPTSQCQLVPLQTPNKYQVYGSQPLTGVWYRLNTCTHTYTYTHIHIHTHRHAHTGSRKCGWHSSHFFFSFLGNTNKS